MITNFKFKPISSPIVDVTDEVIDNGYELIIQYAFFQCRFKKDSAKRRLFL